ncbi:MAG: hypothetical protein UR84_C0024G0004 [candidate division WS6 bacterium GW2011_GWD1_35_594]|nr:MAG: hypothetical protein UR84_C0024G0004 [candidate division WS6 bacterium GW2011_GWD1_35_594]
MKPLNGTKYRKLSKVAQSILADIARSPIPCLELNPGVVNRLEGGGLVVRIQRHSPYKTHMGKMIDHFVVTPKGMREVHQWQLRER